MLYLMKKFSFYFILYFFLVTPPLFIMFNYDRMTGPKPLSLSFPYFLSAYIFVIVFTAIFSMEQMENKFNGYAFLKTLPIKTRDIVASKFTLVLITILLFVGFHCVAFYFISSSPDYWRPSCSLMILQGDLCLVVSALAYIGLFKYGYIKFGKVVIIFWILAIVLPVGLPVIILPKLGMTIYDIIGWMTDLNWILFTVLALVFYVFSCNIAARFLKERE